MTYKEFLAELRKIDGWFLAGRAIRRIHLGNRCQCPLTAVAGLDGIGYFEAAAKLKFRRSRMVEIAHSADDCSESDSKIRRDLLKACGLMEFAP